MLEITRLKSLCLKVHEIMNESIYLDVVFMLLPKDTLKPNKVPHRDMWYKERKALKVLL